MNKAAKQTIKEFVDYGMSALEKNDITEFYDLITMKYGHEFPECFFIGEVTHFLEDCGINTASGLENSIPEYYTALKDAPSSLVNNKVLSFPKHIYYIHQAAFASSHNFEVIDLRGIEEIGPEAFYNTYAHTLIIDDSLEQVNATAFKDTVIEHIKIKHGMSKDKVSNLFLGCKSKHEWDRITWSEY